MDVPNTGHRGQMSAEPIVGIKFRRNGRRKTCLLGGGAGRSSIDRVTGLSRERVLIAQVWSMLFLRL